MDFTLSEAQDRAAPGLARKILAERDDAGLWADLAAAGVLAAGLPEPLGGAGLGLLEQCSVLTELGRAVPRCPTWPRSCSAPARSPGSAPRTSSAAGPPRRGAVGLLTAALAEEDGDDPRAPSASAGAGRRTRLAAVRREDHGARRPAGRADAGARGDAGRGHRVPGRRRPDAGCHGAAAAATGGASAGRVVLDGVRVPADRVLGARARARQITGWLVSRATVGLCALQLGVVERALELTAEYARNRVQFGRPIGGFQAVAQRLADAYIDVEAVRLTMWQAAWQLAAGQPARGRHRGRHGQVLGRRRAATGSRTPRCTCTAALGIDLDYPLHRYFIAAKHNEFALGGATAQLRRIGAALASSG